jgi:ATP adenylyltransferase
MRYVAGPKSQECVFCSALAGADDREALILHRGRHAAIILNLYPYNSGHAMVVPYEHVAGLAQMRPEARAELLELADLFVTSAGMTLHPDGFNLGLNLGEVAGAGVADHLHLHAVPRWLGDSNFMPIVAGTTVMPELLPLTYARLRAEIERVSTQRAGNALPQAGAVVLLRETGMVVLRRSYSGEVLLPKGHVEEGESAAEAAVREVLEETGVDATLAGWAGSQTYTTQLKSGRPGAKHVSFFVAAGTPSETFQAHLERDTLVVSIDAVLDVLSIPAQRQIVAAVMSDLQRLAEVRT